MARAQAAAGDVAGGARTAASAADALEAILTAGATDTDSRTQAAIAEAVAAGLARRAGETAAADARTARAEAILALLPEASRTVLAPIVAREAGK